MGRQSLHISRCEFAFPVEEARATGSALIRRPLLSAHTRIENPHSTGAAVIVHENDQRVALNPPLFYFRQQSPDIVVDIRNHPEELLRCLGNIRSLVEVLVMLRNIERSVW